MRLHGSSRNRSPCHPFRVSSNPFRDNVRGSVRNIHLCTMWLTASAMSYVELSLDHVYTGFHCLSTLRMCAVCSVEYYWPTSEGCDWVGDDRHDLFSGRDRSTSSIVGWEFVCQSGCVDIERCGQN